ncbi:putative transcriptional regulator [Paucibacter oligotrophus]|uniref:Putative transcriptional regulator n=1 Tax=Roseateles oligotrophus TaxID=1769250 RepID=A0A840L174_9BURK|nr:metalloregulator ArsR/SmtB family transcription factor [Roseateles oligotrophus]MBB4842194.1 putative transcriptional regulator [Roseateles oligotrophus]
MEENDVIRALASLAQSHRLRIFRLLVVAGQQGLTPGALGEALALPAATLSFHLKELSQAGLLSQQRLGRNLVYRAAFEQMNGLLAYLSENCCQGEACLPMQAKPCC